MPGRKHAAMSILALPNDIVTLIMKHLVRLHASPKSLLSFLLTSKPLCKPRFKLYMTVVRPFLWDYHLHLWRCQNSIEARIRAQKKKLTPTHLLLYKNWQLTCHLSLLKNVVVF
jgi:hypothetical protein